MLAIGLRRQRSQVGKSGLLNPRQINRQHQTRQVGQQIEIQKQAIHGQKLQSQFLHQNQKLDRFRQEDSRLKHKGEC